METFYIFYLRSVEVHVRILPVLMIEVYFIDSPIYFKSLHRDPKRDKFHSNKPVLLIYEIPVPVFEHVTIWAYLLKYHHH